MADEQSTERILKLSLKNYAHTWKKQIWFPYSTDIFQKYWGKSERILYSEKKTTTKKQQQFKPRIENGQHRRCLSAPRVVTEVVTSGIRRHWRRFR